MICGLEIALLVFGFIALTTGKLKLTGKNEVRGVPARLLGLVALFPLPFSFAFGFFIGLTDGNRLDQYQGLFTAVEVISALVCAAIVFGVGAMIAKPAERERIRRMDDDDDDDRAERRRRRRERDDP